MIISTGMATLAEIDAAVRAARETGNEQIIVLGCTASYPAAAGGDQPAPHPGAGATRSAARSACPTTRSASAPPSPRSRSAPAHREARHDLPRRRRRRLGVLARAGRADGAASRDREAWQALGAAGDRPDRARERRACASAGRSTSSRTSRPATWCGARTCARSARPVASRPDAFASVEGRDVPRRTALGHAHVLGPGLSMTHPLLSVVVPFYNVEAYIDDCLESIPVQNSPTSRSSWSTTGPRTSSAAIAAAVRRPIPGSGWSPGEPGARPGPQHRDRARHGEYLTFVDSDDLVARHAYEIWSRTLDETGSSFAAGNARRFNNSPGVRQSWAAPDPRSPSTAGHPRARPARR